MKTQELLKEGKKILNKNNIEDANLIARILLEFVLNLDRNQLLIKQEQEVEKENKEKYKYAIEKIVKGVPLQYITNSQEFMGLNFYVDENVLIPQPDTEILVEEVIKIVSKENKINILDICTGSGCIGISVENAVPKAKITMSDISKKAIEIAKKNAKENNVLEKIKFIESDMFENIEGKFDIIVSNPPYIETDVINTLSREVQNEPIIALNGGKDGLVFYRKLINEASKYLNNDGYLCMEIGYDQKEKVMELARKQEVFSKIEVIKDLSGNDRVIICRK